MKNKRIKVIVAVGVFGCIATLAQGIEQNLDKDTVKSYVSTHFVEDDQVDKEETINFKEDKENNIIEWLGF